MEYRDITAQDLEELTRSGKTVLLDFWAPWCSPCLQLAPILEALARERQDILVAKVNIEEELQLAKEFRVVSIPTLVVLKDGHITGKAVGLRSRKEILKLLDDK